MEKNPYTKYKQVILVVVVFLLAFFATRAVFAHFKKANPEPPAAESPQKPTNQNP